MELQVVTVPVSILEARFTELRTMISDLRAEVRAPAPPSREWLTYSRFLLEGHMGRTRFTRLLSEKQIESREIGAGRKLYRWREGSKERMVL